MIVEEIILDNYNQYYRLAYSYVHNSDDAEDIVQNGAYKALRASASLRNKEYAKTWVYRIMLNEIFDFLRKPKMESYEARKEESVIEDEHVEDTYADIDLQCALDALPAQEKVIVEMRYFEDKKLEEIADAIGCRVVDLFDNTYTITCPDCGKEINIVFNIKGFEG